MLGKVGLLVLWVGKLFWGGCCWRSFVAVFVQQLQVACNGWGVCVWHCWWVVGRVALLWMVGGGIVNSKHVVWCRFRRKGRFQGGVVQGFWQFLCSCRLVCLDFGGFWMDLISDWMDCRLHRKMEG